MTLEDGMSALALLDTFLSEWEEQLRLEEAIPSSSRERVVLAAFALWIDARQIQLPLGSCERQIEGEQ